VGAKQAFFIFPWFVIRGYSDLKVMCSNLTVDKESYFQKKYFRSIFVSFGIPVTYANYEIQSGPKIS
jgi:hypothetical protein